MKTLFVCLSVSVFFAPLARSNGNPMRAECSSETMGGQLYSPPILANGDIATMADFRNCQFQDVPSYKKIKCVGGNYRPSIYRAGRRTDDKKLACFGRIEEIADFHSATNAEPEKWTQVLDMRRAASETICEFNGGKSRIESTLFVHANLPMIAAKKKFDGELPEKYVFKYLFADAGGKRTPVQTSIDPAGIEDGFDIGFEIEKRARTISGTVSVLCDSPGAEFSDEGAEFSIGFKRPPREVSFFIIFSDDLGKTDGARGPEDLRAAARKDGFARLFASHAAQWRNFWEKSAICIPDKKAENAYCAALYNLKCYSTSWSIPVGIFPSHWNGNYFGFTFFNPALCASGHIAEAEKVARFWNSTLPFAYKRASKKSDAGARWSWQSLEDGSEGTSNGRWLDHVLHLPNIALESWTCYAYSNDQVFLERTAYPVLKGCADFFVAQMIYELKDGRTVIGKCCDLERLPPALENAFLTTCGAVATLGFAAEAADILDTDPDRVAIWRDAAARLKKYLPNDGEKYLPYPNAKERSVAVLSGIYPYGILRADDPLSRAAIYDFDKNAMSAGNMYMVGERICSWYAAWLAAAQARLGDGESAERNIRSALDSVGKFYEICEINEPDLMSVPWCSSPQGTYIQAVNETLLQCEGDTIKIAPAAPKDWKDWSFSLKAWDDIAIDAKASGGNLETLELKAGKNYSGRPKTLILPGGKTLRMEFDSNGRFFVFGAGVGPR